MLDQFRERKLEVTNALLGLCEIAKSTGADTLGKRVDAEVVQKLEAGQFHLVVVGEFNHGKTTFVNALIGEAVLPVGVTPTTAAIHHLVHSDEPTAKVVRADGSSEPVPFAELKKYASGGPSEHSEARYLEVGYPAPILEERIVLVDTPGVNDLSLQRAEITFDYIPRSDAVLFLLDAGQPIKESERQFLETKLIAQSRDKIVFVVTKMDIWSDDERTEALEYIRGQLASLIEEPAVFAVSAHAALDGRTGDSGMPELVAHLTKFLAEERGRIVLDNALGEGMRAAGILRRGIDARRRAATMSAEELGRRVALLEKDLAGHASTVEERRIVIREQTAAIKARAQRDLDRFCDDVIRQLPAQLESAKGDDIKQHLGAFLEHTFQDWAEAETSEIAASLEGLAEEVMAMVRDDARDVGKRVGDTVGGDVQAPSIEVDTFAYDVGVFAVFTLGLGVVLSNALLGGMLLIAAPALAMWVRDKTEAEVRKRALELAPAALREAASKVGPKMDEMIDDFAGRLEQFVVSAGEELHREVIEVLVHAQKERTDTESSSSSIGEACDTDDARLVEVTDRFTALRAELWGKAAVPAVEAAVETAAVESPTNGAGTASDS